MESKKTKLTISGTAKKSIKNIEIAKTQGKNSVVIEKQKNSFVKRRKLAEQRATKRLKGDSDNKKLKLGTKKRETKLTVSRALSDEIEARERSLASVRRAREKEQKNLN